LEISGWNHWEGNPFVDRIRGKRVYKTKILNVEKADGSAFFNG
jgi:hypothetical protein